MTDILEQLEEVVDFLEVASALRRAAPKEMTPDGPVRRFGDVMVAALHTAYNNVADHYYNLGYMDETQRKAVGKSIGVMLDALREAMPQELQRMKVE